jgi:hypothetical protein
VPAQATRAQVVVTPRLSVAEVAVAPLEVTMGVRKE